MKILSITFLLLIILSCSSNDNIVGPDEKTEVIPLSVGNYWKYKIIDFDTSGYAYNEREWLNSITLDTNINSMKYYQFGFPGTIYNNRDNGFYQYYLRHGIIEQENLLFKYPCNLGERYWVNEKDSIYATVFSLDEEIEIQSNKYRCIEYHLVSSSSQKKNIETIYVSPEIGVVMKIHTQQTVDGNNYIESKYTLTEYNLN